MNKTIVSIFLLAVLAVPLPCRAGPPMQVAFINPDPPGSAFWDQATAFMHAVADDLNIRLTVYYGDRGRFRLRDNFLKALQGPDKPDYIITIFQRDMALPLVKAAEASGIKLMTINTDIPPGDRPALGGPREKFPSWIGHLLPDDTRGGHDLMKRLAHAVPTLASPNGPPHGLIGITGSRESTPGIYRKNGCMNALKSTPGIRLEQMVHAYWDRQKAFSATRGLLGRYPEASLIWCAGGVMTSGVLKAILETGKRPGKDILVGTFDWSADTIDHIRRGDVLASAGGHFIEGGWALILLYDYHHGIDFKDNPGVTLLSPLAVMTRDNLDRYEAIIQGNSWDGMDFRQFSRTRTGRRAPYKLGIDALTLSPDAPQP